MVAVVVTCDAVEVVVVVPIVVVVVAVEMVVVGSVTEPESSTPVSLVVGGVGAGVGASLRMREGLAVGRDVALYDGSEDGDSLGL